VCRAFLICAGLLLGCNQYSSSPSTDAGLVFVDPFTPPDGSPNGLRGRILVDVELGCLDCHTPRGPDGAPRMDLYLSGVECFERSIPSADAGSPDGGAAPDGGLETGELAYCLHTRNLTNHPTGLKNRTDDAIKRMFLDGVRPNGEALSPVMPYHIFHNLKPEDADSIVAYLREVPGVDHQLPRSSPIWAVDAPAKPLDPNLVPAVPASAPDPARAERGRYTASVGCIDCHTRLNLAGGPDVLDRSALFAGGRPFAVGLPPPLPPVIYSANLTQAASGLNGYTPEDVVKILKLGRDKHGKGVCPPMPSGPRASFARLSDDAALDIASYILTLPPIENVVPNGCELP
jgi:hypothetical protein